MRIIGHLYRAWDTKIYYAAEHDPICGFWLVEELGNRTNRRDVSERAIGRTFQHWDLCHCRTGLEYPENLTTEELGKMSVFDCCAFDLMRGKCAEKNTIPPMWLCMSDEARQEAATRFLEHGYELGLFGAGVSEDLARRRMDNLIKSGGDPRLAGMVSLWRKVEAERKNSRADGNAHAYFAG